MTKECLEEGMKAVKPWESTIADIGTAIEKHAHANGYSVVEEFCGHGMEKPCMRILMYTIIHQKKRLY